LRQLRRLDRPIEPALQGSYRQHCTYISFPDNLLTKSVSERWMPAYYIGEHIVTNPAVFNDYLAKVVPMIERFGGRYLTKPGTHEILEGDWKPNRVVIVEFPDMASIRAWYGAPEYQPLIAMRQGAATDVMIMLEGR
jgi:uncharacterized protein (DUF1330 family)